MFRKFLSVFLCLALLIATSPGRADDAAPASASTAPVVLYKPPVITPIVQGAAAPFSGVLLTPEAVAKVIADAQECPKRIQVESDHAAAVQKAEDDKTLSDFKADAARDKAVVQADADAKAAQIKTLTTALASAEKSASNNWLWAAGGVVGGALLTIGTVVLVGLAARK